MISPEEILKKAEKYFPTVLKNFLLNVSSFPWEISVGKVSPGELLRFAEPLRILEKNSKQERGFGYRLFSSPKETRKFGTQTLPESIVFDTQSDFLIYIGKEKEFASYQKNVKLILNLMPDLRDWILEFPMFVIEKEDGWEELLEVCDYFRKNPKSGLYIRELPVRVHTKFIEENKTILRKLLDFLIPNEVLVESSVFEDRYGLKREEGLVRFRILDSEISKNCFGGLSDISVPIGEFRSLQIQGCERILLIENKTNFSNIHNFLTIPKLQKTVAIFGKGWGLGILRDCEWLKTKELFYWGDLDVQGFEILSTLREIFPAVRSFLMDRKTFHTFREFAVNGVLGRVAGLRFLSEEESATWELLTSLPEKNRLEQERIPNWYVEEVLSELF
ncbi:Wadjet anti-phage system protein JetD domain-containing protein [Leptospira alstonii]|uniref:PF09983 family protein n=2 Tax=Leptospira alstonii TaxID=28452 RepID=M6CX48_9LEPT|nr:Wadjet anti-phage system protein JetD domain-containing protein [Leptospira alstonii]EMJ93513.1 PF09983 family protein [Leptospira alstonii serovar Sichuan str. 79601]EQA81731.1 PF09983 family protein [Leptospira alstonii serovar Pingchang str. 80-412]